MDECVCVPVSLSLCITSMSGKWSNELLSTMWNTIHHKTCVYQMVCIDALNILINQINKWIPFKFWHSNKSISNTLIVNGSYGIIVINLQKSQHIDELPLDIDISCILFRRSYLMKLNTESVYRAISVNTSAYRVHSLSRIQSHNKFLFVNMSGKIVNSKQV